MSLTTIDRAARDHDLTNCHDTRHTGLDCPACHGVKIACRTHQTPSAGSAKTGVAPVPTEAGTPGGEVEPTPQAPSRPGVDTVTDPTDRVTSTAPFTADRTVTSDGIHLVTVALTDDATRQLARDLTSHMADLILLSRLRRATQRPHASTAAVTEYHRVEDRLASALTARMTTQWELTLTQAEQLLEHLEDAATDPEPCAVGTCTGYAAVGGYCAPHADGI